MNNKRPCEPLCKTKASVQREWSTSILLFTYGLIVPRHSKTCLRACADSEGPDQYGWRAKALMILCACAVWSESAHFAHIRRHFFTWRCPYNDSHCVNPFRDTSELFMPYLIFTILWDNSADDKLMVLFLFFPENRIRRLAQIVCNGDNLLEMSKPVFWEKKKNKNNIF